MLALRFGISDELVGFVLVLLVRQKKYLVIGWWWFECLEYVENEVDLDILSGVAYRKLRSLVRRDVGIVQWFLWKRTLLSGRIRAVMALLPRQKKAVGLCCLEFLRMGDCQNESAVLMGE